LRNFVSGRKYISVDVEPGKYVDIILLAEKIVEYFGVESFDVVISTETLEHVFNWRLVINNYEICSQT
jgi:2-polyprenyl-3-methyl-5-hydroxy-6-metoxy-1,4-benzoquinol methylase